ncbi:MAG: GGDEF domain-containing protein [Eubacterium sp.]|nr:GGDEF domain-containing protein [Eubacterium sp.]
MIGKEPKSDWQNAHEIRKETRQAEGIKAQNDAARIVDAAQADRFAGKDAFDKVMERKAFERTVDDMLHGGQVAGCMLLGDLDRFKDINEIYGRDTGDAVLQSATNILNAYFEECACIGRQAGDVFALWLPGLSEEDADYIRRQAGRVNDRLLHPEKELPPVSVSVGAAFYEDGDDCRSLGKRANRMLYRVKESGRCGCEIGYHDGRSV